MSGHVVSPTNHTESIIPVILVYGLTMTSDIKKGMITICMQNYCEFNYWLVEANVPSMVRVGLSGFAHIHSCVYDKRLPVQMCVHVSTTSFFPEQKTLLLSLILSQVHSL